MGRNGALGSSPAEFFVESSNQIADASYYRKLWIRCGDERGGVPFRVGHANPGGSREEGDATDAEGNGKRGFKGSQPGFVGTGRDRTGRRAVDADGGAEDGSRRLCGAPS